MKTLFQALSVLSAVVCVLLLVLWVRSYWHQDSFFYFYGPDNIGIESRRGNLLPFFQQFGAADGKWRFHSKPIDHSFPKFRHLAFSWNNNLPSYFSAAIPHWFVSIVAAAFAAAPWIRWRFSLRTLLIATTLVAVVLGMIACAAK